MSSLPHAPATLTDLLRLRAAEPGVRDRGYRYLGGEGAALTYAELDVRARALAVSLRDRVEPGERVLLCHPPGLDFLVGLFGTLYAGAIAVPAYPPRPQRPDARLANLAANCRPALALTDEATLRDRARLVAKVDALAAVPWSASSADASLADTWTPPATKADDLAVLQYTSGSTGDARGVMLSHANILHNIEAIRVGMGLEAGTVGVSWLPAFHDMGLVGNLLGAMGFSGTLHVLSPAAFLQEPFRWLEAVSRARAVISGGPCFAFEQCVRRTTPEQRAALDLSSWRVCYTGAEPISARVLDEFAEAFAVSGFRREFFYPCYGLAESSLFVTGATAGRPRVRNVEGRPVVSCGAAAIGTDVRVVDPQTFRTLKGGEVGEVWVNGPSVARGYFERPDETKATFGATTAEGDGPFLRTGDLGFFDDGELAISGRIKDLMIIRGRNVYPQDVEEAGHLACSVLRSGCGAAFAVAEGDDPRLVLVYEVNRGHAVGDASHFDAVRARIADEFAVELHELVLIRTATLPRTSSGKPARRETVRRYLAGELDVVERFTRPAEVVETTTLPAGDGLRRMLHEWLVARIARHLGTSPKDIDATAPFAALGLDSLAGVTIAGELEKLLGRPLSPTVLYSAPTVADLAAALAVAPVAEAAAPAAPASNKVAIIGIGCRFPRAEGVAAFLDVLRKGECVVGPLPAGRDLDLAGVTTDRAGWLADVKGFDAAYFGLNARETPWIDPSHRVLLETAVQALEDAGIGPDRRESTGVFVGVSGAEYARLLADHAGPDTYFGTGNAPSMAAHRISYHLDLHGPSMSVDTACSSSLMAVHLACKSLRDGECDLAIAGGVNLILSPEISQSLSAAQMLAPDGRCKTFDAAADGYVRGEGCGLVVLKPLDAARRDGDRVYAVIEGSATNQDGRSNGITAPSGKAQTSLIRRALSQAGRCGADVTCIEAHGTGTSLGDPIEFDALREALGDVGPPVVLSSVKTNVGHLEAAAGVAGLIKAALQVSTGEVFPHLHFAKVNPLIRLDGSRFALPTARAAWDGPRVCGVSAFGFGGANVHVVLGGLPPLTPDPSPPTAGEGGKTLLAVSAVNEAALDALAASTADVLASRPLAAVASASARVRSRHSHRLAVVASSAADAVALLRDPSRQVRGRVTADVRDKVAFLFTGQGSAYPGMARQLLRTYPTFRDDIEHCERLLRPLGRFVVREVFEDATALNDTAFAQPALFAFEYALARLWMSWGVTPAAMLGHSVGEVVAACIGGALSLEDALALIVRRGRLMHDCPPGAMLACMCPAERLSETLSRWADRLSLAADNGPGQCVLSGDEGSLGAVAMELAEARIDTRLLRVGRGFHSRLIEPALTGLREVAAKLSHRPLSVRVVSNVTGDFHGDTIAPGYWADHARAAVQFRRGVKALHAAGVTHFVEVGPSPVLSRLGVECLQGSRAEWLPSIRGEGDAGEMLRSLARLYVAGLDPEWDNLLPRPEFAALPIYPFQRRSFWVTDLPRRERAKHVDPVKEVAPTPDVAAWRPLSAWDQPLPGPELSPIPAASLPALVGEVWRDRPLAEAIALRPKFDELAGRYVAETWHRLGWRPVAGDRFTLDTLCAELGVVPERKRLAGRLLSLLAEDGVVSFDGVTGQALSRLPAASGAELHAALMREHPSFAVELALTAHCADNLPAVLRGEVDPLAVLFGPESMHLTGAIYQKSPVALFYNDLLARTVSRLVADREPDDVVRVLELGAGTGGTTQALLPLLKGRPCEYVFSDVSSLFLASAKETFAAYDFVQFRTFDLERDGASQGYAAGRFDLVVAANVLHATADLRFAVKEARRLLTSGGSLVLLEGTSPRRLLDLIFGLTEGWWRFRDKDVRPDYPLISADAWKVLLADEGFVTTVVLPDVREARIPDPDQCVIVAQAGAAIRAASAAAPAVTGPTVREGAAGASLTHRLPGGADAAASPAATHALAHARACDEPATTVLLDPDLDPALADLCRAAARDYPDGRPVVRYTRRGRFVPVAAPSTTVIAAATDDDAPSREALLAAPPFERRGLVERYLRRELAKLLGGKLSDDDMDQPVQALGLDSLMAIQVRNKVEASLGVSLSLVDFLKGMRVRELVDRVAAQVAPPAVVAPPPEPAAASAGPDDLDAMLLELMRDGK